MRAILVFSVLLISNAVWAQDAPPSTTAQQQVAQLINTQIGALVVANVQLTAQLQEAHQTEATLGARIGDLEKQLATAKVTEVPPVDDKK
jgi:hypothetical protein